MNYEKQITAIAAHWNGACYSADGEGYCDYDSLDAAIAAADGLLGMYDTDADGDVCDVDLEWQICDDGEIVRTITVQSSVGEQSQVECAIIASAEGEYSTDHIGVNSDGDLVRWSVNGGTHGAHDRMDGNRGEWHEVYETPEKITADEWLSLGLSYGADLHDLHDALPSLSE